MQIRPYSMNDDQSGYLLVKINNGCYMTVTTNLCQPVEPMTGTQVRTI